MYSCHVLFQTCFSVFISVSLITVSTSLEIYGPIPPHFPKLRSWVAVFCGWCLTVWQTSVCVPVLLNLICTFQSQSKCHIYPNIRLWLELSRPLCLSYTNICMCNFTLNYQLWRYVSHSIEIFQWMEYKYSENYWVLCLFAWNIRCPRLRSGWSVTRNRMECIDIGILKIAFVEDVPVQTSAPE